MSARYAVYFAPDRHSPWRMFGAHWLGRDEHDNSVLTQPDLAGILPSELARFTEEPRRYGFHATLKAPFRLAAGVDESRLVTRLSALALKLKLVPLGPMGVTQIKNFVALVPINPELAYSPTGLQALAATCVVELDDLRAPLLPAELARRQTSPLDSRANELLDLYGYPYVMERFRLHMTLTGQVDAPLAQRVMAAVVPEVARLNAAAPLWLDRLCLFVESAPGAPFHRILDLKLRA